MKLENPPPYSLEDIRNGDYMHFEDISFGGCTVDDISNANNSIDGGKDCYTLDNISKCSFLLPGYRYSPFLPQFPPQYSSTRVISPLPDPHYGIQFPAYPVYPGGPPYAPAPHTALMPAQPQAVVTEGDCPHCKVGVLEDNYSCCAILTAILLFPFGLLCCMSMKNRVCTYCGVEHPAEKPPAWE